MHAHAPAAPLPDAPDTHPLTWAYPLTVLLTFMALPYPVSPSPMMGMERVASWMLRPCGRVGVWPWGHEAVGAS